ncbi:MAG: LuxR family transcriptional regulator [Pseudonocardiales bacterium]|nr:LuxR family transcriptional regulator [Pseudonocardiales bacterium]
MVLLGRRNECETVDRLLSATRLGHGGTVVIHGEPGIGKSALLAYATESATGFQVLGAVGNEAERELPYATAQQLCASNLATLDQLPAPQRDALDVAFGHVSGSPPDRLFVGLALLGLLSQIASKTPVLCLVDDAQWLDHESAQAFAIAARRVRSERIAFVFGARTVPEVLTGFPDLSLHGLGPSDARALLRSALPEPFDESVTERILAETRGNPLALIELPRGMTTVELAGGFALPASVPVAGRLQSSFRRRIAQLPETSRRLLLVAAAEPTGDPALVWAAAQRLGVDESAATAVEAEGLLQVSPRIIFRHPLVRSAVYEAASPADRRDVHRALAEATDPAADPDRRAWHRAQATWHPDDDVAAELEVSAGRAEARGGIAASAAFLERAAELTVDPKQRVARMLAAAEAKRQAGALEAALELAARAERSPLDDHQRAQLDALRGEVSFASQRGRDAPRLLLAAAQRLDLHDPRRAWDTYLDAMKAALFAGNLTNGVDARDVARAVLAAPQPLEPPAASDLLLQGLALLVAEGPVAGTPVARQALEKFRGNSITTDERLRWSWLAGRTAAFIWDYEAWDALTNRQVEVALATGALSVLPLTLSTTAGVQLFAGRLSEAESLFQQAEAVADATDTRTAAYAAVLVAAFRGYEQEAREFIDSAATDFAARGEGMGVTLTRCASAVLGNGLARYDEAYIAAQSALEDPYELWFWPWATVELIEAASRTARAAEAMPAFERLTESTASSGTVWGAAVEDRCRALLSQGALAEGLYRSAIDRLSPTPLRLDLARTHLLFGEWLRRENRPAEARDQLRAAHTLFTDFGSDSYAERARIELRAAGERTRKRSPDAPGHLAPQEARVAELVAQGGTNAEIAAQMFISPSTVEYHLHKVFRKLGVKSRTQLAKRVLESAQENENG